MRYDFEIGIVGGGPAGSTAASYLAGYGFEVCLIEKKIFPRETLCGEFLSSEVIHYLKELNLFNEFISLNPNRISSFCFINDSGKNIRSKFNFEAYGLSRSLFDNLLLCNSKRKGVTVFQPAEVKKIIRLKGGFNLNVKNKDQKEVSIRTKFLIAAYGKQNPLDDLLNRNFAKYKSRLNGVKFHLSKDKLISYPEDEIQIYAADNIYCGVNAVDNNKVIFCFLEDRSREQPPPRKQLIELGEKNQFFKKMFEGNSENIFDDLPVYGTGNIYFGKRNLVENGIIMIGDSAGVIAPLAGDGIGIAMESGKLIADLFSRKRTMDLSVSELELSYIKEWNSLFLRRMKTAKVIQNFVLSGMKRKAGYFLIKSFPSLLSYLIKGTRNILEQTRL